jgi:hypothetical protein
MTATAAILGRCLWRIASAACKPCDLAAAKAVNGVVVDHPDND